MNDRLETLRMRVLERNPDGPPSAPDFDLRAELDPDNLSWVALSARLTCLMCAREQPVITPEERIVFTRTTPSLFPEFAEIILQKCPPGATLHELGPVNNLCADWGTVLRQGLLERREQALRTCQRLSDDPDTCEFLDAALATIEAVLDLTQRYRLAAECAGRLDLVEILDQVPAHPPRTFHESLQSLRILHSVVWLSGSYHVGLGRLDQYLWPYLQADLAAGNLTEAQAEELLAEFFISLNRDSLHYPGVQQGDNGQTITLGGVRPDGASGVNPLTFMALRVGRDLSLIDPKINLRISTQEDLELLSLASELTRKGLGFPQYSNDEVVIPGLVAHGYALEDARDYTVAACWEFIIPGRSMEVVNIGAVSLPYAVDQAVRQVLGACGETASPNEGDFGRILEQVDRGISAQVTALVAPYRKLFLPPAPFYSVLMDGCLENGRDLSAGLKYNNFGIHGAGSSNAADALAAVRQMVFTERSIQPAELLAALESDFSGWEELQVSLREQAPKVAMNSVLADEMLVFFFDSLAKACEEVGENGRGGIIRPGSGSAMYYLWLAQGHEGMREPLVGATADGRLRGEPFSANLAPSPGVLTDGLLSLLSSYSKIDYRRVCNGGPITIELSDSVFRSEESIRKVAMLVRTFAQLGCQQLQLNSLNPAALQDAKIHPELHRNLIVRVWGWSGYFCELAPEYQDHVINRTIYT